MSTEESSNRSASTEARSSKSVIARADDLHLHFDTNRGEVKALDGVSFDIFEGETLALVGETGCGKTITARSFMQLVPTPPGRYVDGHALLRSEETCTECDGAGCSACYQTGRRFDDMLTLSQKEMQKLRGKRTAMVFQDPQAALNPSLRISEQVAESIVAHQLDEVLEEAGISREKHGRVAYSLLRREASAARSLFSSLATAPPPLRKQRKAIEHVIRERILDVLRQTNIANPREILNKYPHELSGGMKQRVMIAMALVSKPDLLIADEPTTALDVTTQARILNMINDLQDEYNTSLLYITHDLSLVEDIADRVTVMYAGQVAEAGPTEQLFADPQHPYTRGLIDSIPSERRRGEPLATIGGSVPDLSNPPEGCRFCTRCPDVMDHCSSIKPHTVEKTPGHIVNCHLYTDQEPTGRTVQPEETTGESETVERATGES